MISNKTIEFLNRCCDLSDKMFQNGGTNYIFKYGRKLAHCLQEKHNVHLDYSNELNQTHLNQLLQFFHVAEGGDCNDIPSIETNKICSSLIELLQADIDYEYMYITDYSLDTYSSEIKIVMVKENDYYSLELMWLLD